MFCASYRVPWLRAGSKCQRRTSQGTKACRSHLRGAGVFHGRATRYASEAGTLMRVLASAEESISRVGNRRHVTTSTEGGHLVLKVGPQRIYLFLHNPPNTVETHNAGLVVSVPFERESHSYGVLPLHPQASRGGLCRVRRLVADGRSRARIPRVLLLPPLRRDCETLTPQTPFRVPVSLVQGEVSKCRLRCRYPALT